MSIKIVLLFLLALPAFAQSHQYWRLNGASTAFMSVGNLVFYDNTNTPISTSGGTASASSVGFGEVQTNAFLGNTDCSTFWLANGTTGWLEMAFTGAVAVDHIGVTHGCNGGRGFPIMLQLQYSDNNSTWTTLYEWDGISSPTTTTTVLTSANAAPTSPGIWWRLQFTVASGCVGMNSLAFFTGAGGGGSSISLARIAATASAMFNDQTGPYGAIAVQTGGWDSASAAGTYNYTYAFPTVQSVGSIQFSNGNIGGCGQVNNLVIQYSLNNSTWVTTNTYTPSWVGTQTKTFDVTSGGPTGQMILQ